MPHIGHVLILPRPFLRNRRSRGGVGCPPAHQTTPAASPLTRFLACCRGAVALESALAVIPLMICLVGVFEIVQSVFVRDLLQRATYQVAYSNALEDSAASDATQLRDQCLQAINTEVGGFLNFALVGEGACSTTPSEGSPAVDFCLKVTVTVYDNPSSMLNGTASTGSNAGLGGDAGDMVVVTVVATSQSVLSQLQQGFFGNGGMMVTAVRRNERQETA